MSSASEKQLSFFEQLPDNGDDRLRQRLYSDPPSRGIRGDKAKQESDKDNSLVEAIVIQIGFLRPNFKITVEVDANSILLKRISDQWPSSIITSGKDFAMVETPKQELRLPLVFGVPKEGISTSPHNNDRDHPYTRTTGILGEILGKLINNGE